jgi:hypothetical protein
MLIKIFEAFLCFCVGFKRMRTFSLKINSLIMLMTFLTITPLAAASKVEASDILELAPTDNHHIIELNSNQPYVAGYHVNTPDLGTRERVLATAVTVSFPSTDPSFFPTDSWLGGGMFVQAQDSQLRFVDYGFYTILVLDAEGRLFLDVGMHQTREETPPLHMPTEQLVYAYTWQILGIGPTTAVTLYARWNSEGRVQYSIYASGSNVTLPPIDVADFPNCEAIIKKFYAGNVVVGPFPFSRYVQYFQFGVVSSRSMPSNHWSVDLKDPQFLRETGWTLVDIAWSIEGDISYLDYSWMWGGSSYHGVSAQYYGNSLESPYEVIFFYSGQSLPPGTVLWQYRNPNPSVTVAFFSIVPQFNSEVFGNCVLSLSIWILTILRILAETNAISRLRKCDLEIHV